MEISRNILAGFLLKFLEDQYDMAKLLKVPEKIKDNSMA